MYHVRPDRTSAQPRRHCVGTTHVGTPHAHLCAKGVGTPHGRPPLPTVTHTRIVVAVVCGGLPPGHTPVVPALRPCSP